MRRSLYLAFSASLLLLLLASCFRSGKGAGNALANRDSVITVAKLLSMHRTAHYTTVTVGDPWRGGVLHRYVLVPRDRDLPADLPEGTVVRTPISNALVYSSVHTSLFNELGSLDAVKGVVDKQYFNDSTLVAGINDGTITDCGNSMNPTVERVINMQPDAILLSPYQDASYGQIAKMDIPIIECADYLEYDPLGRAEWVKFYGELLGKRDRADSLYQAVVDAYNDMKHKAGGAKTHPTVVTEMVINGIWNVPGGKSYMARILADAGGRYLWADDENTGSLALDFNQVLAVAQEADYWFIKWTNINSLRDLQGANELNKEMSAFKHGRVYVCDTDKTRFFDRIPFHPEVLLREFSAILHPELFPEYHNQMYHHID